MDAAEQRLDQAATAAAAATAGRPLDERADAVEHALGVELDRVATKSVLFMSGDVDPTKIDSFGADGSGRFMLLGQDPRLQPMPDRPTLMDFLRLRFRSYQHMLQSARLARLGGHDEKVVLACLLHDIAVVGFIRPDHG
jgi:hypothetical protein